MGWQHLRHSANVSGNYEQSAAGSLENGNAEGLGKGSIQEDMASAEHISHLVMRQAAEQLDSLPEVVLLHQFVEVSHSFTISSEDEVDVLELSQDLWDDSDQEIDSFPIC